MKRRWLRALFGMFSFTAAMFVFQACYGMPQKYDGNTTYDELENDTNKQCNYSEDSTMMKELKQRY